MKRGIKHLPLHRLHPTWWEWFALVSSKIAYIRISMLFGFSNLDNLRSCAEGFADTTTLGPQYGPVNLLKNIVGQYNIGVKN